jgi:uncharacterized membrane protein
MFSLINYISLKFKVFLILIIDMFFSSRYSIGIFIGIIIDIGAANRSTASYNQFVIFQKI